LEEEYGIETTGAVSISWIADTQLIEDSSRNGLLETGSKKSAYEQVRCATTFPLNILYNRVLFLSSLVEKFLYKGCAFLYMHEYYCSHPYAVFSARIIMLVSSLGLICVYWLSRFYAELVNRF